MEEQKMNKLNLNALENLIGKLKRKVEDPLLASLYKDGILDELLSDSIYIHSTLEENPHYLLHPLAKKDLQEHFNHMKAIVENDPFNPFFHLIGGIEEILK
jgi:hypothetical protein